MAWVWGATACGNAGEPPAGDTSTGDTATATASTDATGMHVDETSSTRGDATSTGPASSEGSTGDPTDGLDCNALPPSAPAWLRPHLEEIVAALTGEAEIRPGVVLPERSTLAHRQEAAGYLVDRFDALGLKWFLHEYGDGGTNVYAYLPSTTGNDAVIVLGAHYDSVPGSPGANDNATGVALVLAVTRWAIDLPCRDASVVFVLFDEEEVGLVGSWSFAGFLVDAGVEVLAAHTVDQMGWDADGDRAIELERADEGLFEIYDDAVATAGLSIPLHSTNTGFTDHVSFREWGIPAIGLTEEFVNGDTTPHYHLPSDTYETVDFDYLASTTELVNVAFASLLAR